MSHHISCMKTHLKFGLSIFLYSVDHLHFVANQPPGVLFLFVSCRDILTSACSFVSTHIRRMHFLSVSLLSSPAGFEF